MVTSLLGGTLSNDLKGEVAKMFLEASPGPPLLLASLAFGLSILNTNFVRTGLTSGLHSKRTFLFMVVRLEGGKRAKLQHFIFRKFGDFAPPLIDPWPSLIDRSHDAPEFKCYIHKRESLQLVPRVTTT